jgi:hypothetical protein
MAKSRHTAEQIIAIPRQGERDDSVLEVAGGTGSHVESLNGKLRVE